jgi:hypothetical protein
MSTSVRLRLILLFITGINATVLCVVTGWLFVPLVFGSFYLAMLYGTLQAVQYLRDTGGMVVVMCPHCQVERPDQGNS